MLVETVTFIVGLALLIKGSDLFVESASRVAKGFGVSEFIIALVLASVATTLPEVTVSATAAFDGRPDVALGNGIGSAVANIAFILGLCSIIMPLNVDKAAWRNSTFMVAVTFLAWLLMFDGTLSRLDGGILIAIYFGFLYYLYRKHMTLEEVPEGKGNPRKEAIIMFLSGIIVVVGAKLVVKSAVVIARTLGISETVIALTLVAIGTSLPELANSLTATLKKIPNISVGNVIGANILDILMVLGVSSIIAPIPIPRAYETFVMPLTLLVMLILTVSLRLNNRVGRKTGTVLLLLYAYFLYRIFPGG